MLLLYIKLTFCLSRNILDEKGCRRCSSYILCVLILFSMEICQVSKVFIFTENFGTKCLSVSKLIYFHVSLKIIVF